MTSAPGPMLVERIRKCLSCGVYKLIDEFRPPSDRCPSFGELRFSCQDCRHDGRVAPSGHRRLWLTDKGRQALLEAA